MDHLEKEMHEIENDGEIYLIDIEVSVNNIKRNISKIKYFLCIQKKWQYYMV
jgi:hypothetical protein